MSDNEFNQIDINKLINSAWSNENPLKNAFEKRLSDLGITLNQAVDNLQIEYRTLNGILEGTLKRLDFVSLLKIAHFLDISYKEISDLYVRTISMRYKDDLDQSKRRTFILNHFDLPVLKSIGVIDSIKDEAHIEEKLKAIFGLNNIMDFDIEDIGAAYSSTRIKVRNEKTRNYFIRKSKTIFKLIANPHKYNKEGLVEYFPKIRWHSTDINNGIVNVIKALYELGVTVIFQPSMPSLQLRGATFAVDDKPCIVLTDFRSSYPTMWFAFLHELFHVVFDWPEIQRVRYHLSDEENDLLVVRQKEEEANEFAREYLFPKDRLELISSKMNQRVLVKEYASDNHVDPSLVYAIDAYLNSSEDNNLWAQYDKFMPPVNNLVRNLSNNLSHKSSAAAFAEYYKNRIFNT